MKTKHTRKPKIKVNIIALQSKEIEHLRACNSRLADSNLTLIQTLTNIHRVATRTTREIEKVLFVPRH